MTDASARFALPFLFPGQSQKEFTVNESLARLDILLHPAVAGEFESEPAAPEIGEIYLVGKGATGVFHSHDSELASWDGDQWTFVTPRFGMCARDISSGSLVWFDGEWHRATTPSLPAEGAVIDSEARNVITEIIMQLRSFGIFS